MDIIGSYIGIAVVALIVTYILAGFLLSFKRLHPIFSIVISIAAIVVSIFAYKNPSIRWIPIVLTIWSQIFYQGECYMTPQIQENVYRLVKIERRWESLFAENDKYELHFAPVETGGFLVNTILYTILFSICYGVAFSYPSYGWAYAIPIYHICMSIMDILYFNGFPLTDFIHRPVQILVCALAIHVGIVVTPFTEEIGTSRTKSVYEQCLEVANIDYSKSYKIEYIVSSKSGYDYIAYDGFNFIYDANLQAGGYYYTENNTTIYTSVIYKDLYSSNLLQYVNTNSQTIDFEFEKYASVVGGPLKYIALDHPFDTYTKFREAMFYNATQFIKEDNSLSLIYDYSNYTVFYSFNTDNKDKPTSIRTVRCTIYVDDYKYQIIYTPLSGKTDLNNLFNEYKTLGYGYMHNETEDYGIDTSSIFSMLGNEDVLNYYDFTLKETYNGNSSMYVYDSDMELVGLYTTNYFNSYNAITNNDFYTYMPDYYINNDYGFIQNLYNWEMNFAEDNFVKYTYDNVIATKVITKGLLAFSDIMTERVEVNEDDIVVNVVCLDVGISDTNFVEYKVYYNNDSEEYEIYKIEVNTIYEGREYTLTMYYDDVFNLM